MLRERLHERRDREPVFFFEDGRVVEAPWDPAALPPGNYILRVLVADESGNEAMAGRDVPLTLAPAVAAH